MLTKLCLQCSKNFEKPYSCGLPEWSERKFCSRKCHDDFRRMEIANCLICHNPVKRAGKRYCSRTCSESARRGSANNMWKGGQVKLKCVTCHKEFLVDKYRAKAKCCSKECSNILRSTPEHRLTLSETQRSKVPPEHVFVRSFTSLLKTCSKYSMWREAILKRDNYTCQLCQKRGGKLQVDHIEPFIKIILDNKIKDYDQAIKCRKLWSTKNGRTLCTPCHYKTPTFGSKVLKLITK